MAIEYSSGTRYQTLDMPTNKFKDGKIGVIYHINITSTGGFDYGMNYILRYVDDTHISISGTNSNDVTKNRTCSVYGVY